MLAPVDGCGDSGNRRSHAGLAALGRSAQHAAWRSARTRRMGASSAARSADVRGADAPTSATGRTPTCHPAEPLCREPLTAKCAAASRPATDCACSSTASVAPAAHRRAYRAADRCCTSGGGILPAATDRCVRASGGLPATHGPRRRRRAAACVGACAAYCANRLVPAKPVQALHRSSSYPLI